MFANENRTVYKILFLQNLELCLPWTQKFEKTF